MYYSLDATSPTQCRDKLKYLKMRYMRTKDNMKRSGAAPIMFDYFEQMDKCLGEKPNVEPVAIAFSSRDPVEINSKYLLQHSSYKGWLMILIIGHDTKYLYSNVKKY
jgi:hypothetical protein